MAVITELETATRLERHANHRAGARRLATTLQGGDENLRLGFEVHGAINTPTDQDVYSFQATAGTQVWINIDQTTFSLDTMVELVTPMERPFGQALTIRWPNGRIQLSSG